MPFCRSSLNPIDQDGFSPAASRKLFGTRKAPSHLLEFTREEAIAYRNQKAERFSISGVQDKVSLKLEKGKLLRTTEGGEYILKPIPFREDFKHRAAVPANEHLCMQLAEQLFKISTPPSALVDLSDGAPAYLVRRFDRRTDGTKTAQEDFCQLSNRTEETHGKNYKYDATQESTGNILKTFCPAYSIEIEKLYNQHLFNYVFSNGDAQLKNFSLQQSDYGDYSLSPAYDLLCTSMHFPNESRCALDLFDNDENETKFYKMNAFYGREDFLLLAEKIGMEVEEAQKRIETFHDKQSAVAALVEKSFFNPEQQTDFLDRYADRLRALR